jgi:hypothetical protein
MSHTEFDWMHAEVPPQKGDPYSDQFVRAIRERVRLLSHLGFDHANVVRRIQADLAWELDPELTGRPLPAFYAQVPALVGEQIPAAEAPKKRRAAKKK